MWFSYYVKALSFTGEKTLHPFRYQGQYEDEETGLYYNRFRCYLSDTIVFLDCITMSCILR
ncbi:hypothetical protein HER15_11170 [Tenacibaculum mesophilum]|uniref:Uncharacterized protein n=1 Tax=Tenacibaculum mesophilum TaxID=104268 RepID=A0AAE9MPR4_9FLAO|nr:hypothetical protein HER15_11170 [Tenacibaculum mesophilum]